MAARVDHKSRSQVCKEHRQQVEFIRNLFNRLLVEQRPACMSNSSRSLSWPKPAAPPALRPETSRHLGSVQNNRRVSAYKRVWPLPSGHPSPPSPLQLEETRPKEGWDGERWGVSWTPSWPLDSLGLLQCSFLMAKHLGSANGASCQLLMVAVSHHDAVDVVMGFLLCNLLSMWETLEGGRIWEELSRA